MSGARPRLISSTISTFGRVPSARPTASICCSPPGEQPGPPVEQLAQGREVVEHLLQRRL